MSTLFLTRIQVWSIIYIFKNIKVCLKNIYFFLMRWHSYGSVAWVMNARYVLLKRRRPPAYAPLLKGYRSRKTSSCVSAVCCWWLKCSYVRACNHFFIWISLFWWWSSVYSFSDQPPITPHLLLIVCTPVSTHILPPSPLNWRKKNKRVAVCSGHPWVHPWCA